MTHATRGSEAPYFGRAFMLMEVLCTLILCSLLTLLFLLFGTYNTVSMMLAAIRSLERSEPVSILMDLSEFWMSDIPIVSTSSSASRLLLYLISFFIFFVYNACFEFEDSGTLLGRMAV